MPYLSLYRKYRSRNFGEVVGQRHVTQTLANAVKANRVAHAYLFCGPRGTGKTSTARVLAMALNCENGPTAEPCGACHTCERILAGSALDVIEIDAASNRGIDEIRELRDRVALAPADSRSKVYIIDEVHMLTGEAFNAFLKTLEEPPAHVVFVLATTEPHRVLPTILSRCQRFDFHRVGVRDIETVIRGIAEREELELDDRAVAMLAHAADGSVRDALTLLDQAIAYAAGAVTPEVISEILGGIDFALLAELTDVFVKRDVAAALALIDRVVAEGKDLRQLLGELIEHYRNILLLRVDRRGQQALALPEEATKRTIAQAGALSADEIVRTLDLLAETDRELRFSSQPRLLVELSAVRICRGVEGGPPSEQPEPPAAARAAAAAASVERPEPGEPPTQEVAEPSGRADLSEIKRRWDEVLAHLKKTRSTAVAAFLRESVPLALEGGVLTLAFNHLFHHDQMMKDERRRKALADAIESLFGIQVQVRCQPPHAAEAAPPPAKEEGPGQHDGLQDVMSMFPGSELEE